MRQKRRNFACEFESLIGGREGSAPSEGKVMWAGVIFGFEFVLGAASHPSAGQIISEWSTPSVILGEQSSSSEPSICIQLDCRQNKNLLPPSKKEFLACCHALSLSILRQQALSYGLFFVMKVLLTIEGQVQCSALAYHVLWSKAQIHS